MEEGGGVIFCWSHKVKQIGEGEGGVKKNISISPIIYIGQEIQCLLYARFLFKMLQRVFFLVDFFSIWMYNFGKVNQ